MTKGPTVRAVKKLLTGGHPKMVAAADIALVGDQVKGLSQDAVIVEMGPWLGAISRELASAGNLHVVDNFVWTADHAKRVPDIVKPGQSFQPLYEKIMSVLGLPVEVHSKQFADFKWDGPPIDFLFIDSPKTPDALCECLVAVADSLAAGSRVLVKNGLNIKQHDMLVYIDRLIHSGLFKYAPENGKTKSNILMMDVGDIGENVSEKLLELLKEPETPLSTSAGGALTEGPYLIAKMIKLVEAGNLTEAYKELSALEPDMANVQLWERLEPSIRTGLVSPSDLAIFSEILVHHNDPISYMQPVSDLSKGAMQMLRSLWSVNGDKSWRAEAFQPAIFQKAMSFGYMNWANKLDQSLAGKDVLDVGCGPGFHGLGYLALGANNYLGVDPSLRMDKDRAKNLVSKSREHFGWTPSEISQKVTPWDVRPIKIEDLETDQRFDVALLLDVLAHVDDLDNVLAKVASLLRPDGVILLRHKNFYCWNGHQQKPNKVNEIDPDSAEHKALVDWNHIAWEAPADHYISRMLNRAKLDEVIDAIKRYFIIDSLSEVKLRSETGLGRLTDKVRKRYPDLTDHDFETQSIFLTGRLLAPENQSHQKQAAASAK